MKVIYSSMSQDITSALISRAKQAAKEGKQVFYIAPNSLSFEKEMKVLRDLDQHASFSILVTRFPQLARYLFIKESVSKKQADDTALAMLVYKCLSAISESELRVYGPIKKDPAFHQQIVELYKDLQSAGFSYASLETLNNQEKAQDLITILTHLEEELLAKELSKTSILASMADKIEQDSSNIQGERLALLVDGFTRFTADEERFLAALDQAGVEINIGSYASQKAARANFIEGNLYQASLLFMRNLASKYGAKLESVEGGSVATSPKLSQLSRLLESKYDFSYDGEKVKEAERVVALWNLHSPKSELEAVASQIRKKVAEGSRYKDFRLLLGSVDDYFLELQTIFDQYDIPFYLGRNRSMASHPLVYFFTCLEGLKSKNFKRDDLIHLLKTGLYLDLTEEEIDLFEQYLQFADLSGIKALQKEFHSNPDEFFDLERLNAIRERVMDPLVNLFKIRKQKTTSILDKFLDFLSQVNLTNNLEKISRDLDQEEKDNAEEVWKHFLQILEQLREIFEQDKLGLEDLLHLLSAALSTAQYRTLPATIDVVSVQSYDLVEPHIAPYVFAIGLSQENFPKSMLSQGLLTEEEKEEMNLLEEEGHFQLASQEELAKNHYVFLSLMHSAKEELYLSAPSHVQNKEMEPSSYLKEVESLGISFEENLELDPLVSYKALLGRLVDFYQSELQVTWSKEERDYWASLARVLSKELEKRDLSLPAITGRPSSQKLSSETLERLYPKDQTLRLSTSALSNFYRNPYGYFLQSILKLQENRSIHPDPRINGTFLHYIMEKASKFSNEGQKENAFDLALAHAMDKKDFQSLYERDDLARFTQTTLIENAQAAYDVIKDLNLSRLEGLEKPFNEKMFANDPRLGGHSLEITGKIDRLDQLQSNKSMGVVDFKSGDRNFNYADFFNGLDSQLPTYLWALKQGHLSSEKEIFAALYLQLSKKMVSLAKVDNQIKLEEAVAKGLLYKGLFIQGKSDDLVGPFDKNAAKILSDEELDTLLAYNEKLYLDAAKQILAGEFPVAPYSKDGKSVEQYTEQYKAITGYESDLHADLMRKEVKQANRKTGANAKKTWLEQMKEEMQDE